MTYEINTQLLSCKHCPEHGGTRSAIGAVQFHDFKARKRQLWALCPECLAQVGSLLKELGHDAN